MAAILRKSRHLTLQCASLNRQVQTNSHLLENLKEVQNKNPRNLELMTIGRKPTGYHLEEDNHEFWHKVTVHPVSRFVTANVQHYKNGIVVSASTQEWALKKYLYKLQDVPAYSNLGKILAVRCIEAGITSLHCDIRVRDSTKLRVFLEGLKSNGIQLKEARRYKEHAPWDWRRGAVKPWHVYD